RGTSTIRNIARKMKRRSSRVRRSIRDMARARLAEATPRSRVKSVRACRRPSRVLHSNAMPTYSNSRLSAYENCPMQYRLRYVDQVVIPPRESIEAYLGKRVHEALEFLYQRIEGGYKPTLAEVHAHFREAWDREWNETIHI